MNILRCGLANAGIDATKVHMRALTRQRYGYHSAEALIGVAMVRRGGPWPRTTRPA